MLGKRVDRGLEADQHPDRTAAHLPVGIDVVGARGVDLAQRLAPAVGRLVDLHHQARQRPARGLGHAAHQLELARTEIGVDLDHTLAGAFHRLRQPLQLGVVGRQRGHSATVASAVLVGPGAGKAQRALVQGLFEHRSHVLDLCCAWPLAMVGAAVTHRIQAKRCVRHLGAHIHDPRHRCDAVHELRKGLPVKLHAFAQHDLRDVFNALHQVDQVGHGTRANRREADAAVAEHSGRHTVPRRRCQERIPGGLPVVMGVDVDEAGGHQQTSRVNLAPAWACVFGHCGDQACVYRHVSDPARRARAVDHRTASDD